MNLTNTVIWNVTASLGGPLPLADIDPGQAELSVSALEAIWIGAALIVAVTCWVAYILYWIIRPRGGKMTAVGLGRKWAAWVAAFATISLIPEFFRKFNGSSIALWILVVPFFTTTAFVMGWVVGFLKYRNGDPLPAAAPVLLGTNDVTAPPGIIPEGNTTEKRLEKLRELFERELISEEDYAEKRREILSNF